MIGLHGHQAPQKCHIRVSSGFPEPAKALGPYVLFFYLFTSAGDAAHHTISTAILLIQTV